MSCHNEPTTERLSRQTRPGRRTTRHGWTETIPTRQLVSFSRKYTNTTTNIQHSTPHIKPNAHKMHTETYYTAVGSGSPHRPAPHRTDTIQRARRKKLKGSGCKRKRAQARQQQRPGNIGWFPMPDDTSMNKGRHCARPQRRRRQHSLLGRKERGKGNGMVAHGVGSAKGLCF